MRTRAPNGGIRRKPAAALCRPDRQVVVVSGGTSGIGLASTQAFAREGAAVFVTGRREEELQKAADQRRKAAASAPTENPAAPEKAATAPAPKDSATPNAPIQ